MKLYTWAWLTFLLGLLGVHPLQPVQPSPPPPPVVQEVPIPPPHEEPKQESPREFGAVNLIDYKFWYIRRNDAGQITEAAIRFYLGAITTQDETKPDGTVEAVTRYRRSQRVTSFPGSFKGFKVDANGNIAKLYTDKDFGVISTDDELRLFVNGELAKVATFAGVSTVSEQTDTR